MFTAAENSTSPFPNTDKNLSEIFFFFLINRLSYLLGKLQQVIIR